MSTTRRPTLNDLATELGLSANTVSRALAGKDGVSGRTRTLVLAEARRSGYLAGAEVSTAGRDRASRTIAVTIPSASHQFSTELIGAIESGARAGGYSLDLFTTEESEQQEQQIAATIDERSLAGVICIPVQGRSKPWTPLAAAGLPLVTVSRRIPDLACDLVTADNEAGAYAAARHLLAQGCRRIIQLEEDLEISTIAQRRRGFGRAMGEVADSSAEVITVPTRRFEAAEPRWRAGEAYGACRRLIASGEPVEAVCAGDDYFALGALRAFTESGIRVPEDVRLVGFGDHPYAAWLTPSLSSVQIPTQLIGELAVSLLLQRIAGETMPPVRRSIKPELIIRGSSVLHPAG